jgi:phage-related protein
MAMSGEPVLRVVFFRSESNTEPVRDWLKELDTDARKTIGEEIKLIQFRWPLGMPYVRKLQVDLWEVRVRLGGNRTARVLFTIEASEMILLHGFIKKSQKTPPQELEVARARKKQWRSGWNK